MLLLSSASMPKKKTCTEGKVLAISTFRLGGLSMPVTPDPKCDRPRLKQTEIYCWLELAVL